MSPDWYWHRWATGCSPVPRYIDIHGYTMNITHEPVHADKLPGEWWPIPITPPEQP